MSLSVGTVVHNSCYTTVHMCLWGSWGAVCRHLSWWYQQQFLWNVGAFLHGSAQKRIFRNVWCSLDDVKVEQALSFADLNCSSFLCVGSRAARAKVAVSGVPNRLNYRVIVTVHTQFTLVAAGLVTQTGGPGAADPWSKPFPSPIWSVQDNILALTNVDEVNTRR